MGVQGAQSSTWDQLFEEIEGGRAYTQGTTKTASASLKIKIQLFNPAGSGKNAQVVNAALAAAGIGTYVFFANSTSLGQLDSAGLNLLTGLFDSACEVRWSQSNAVNGDGVHAGMIGAHNPFLFWDKWGPVVTPGKGVLFEYATFSQSFSVRFDWFEYDV